jgi:LPS-assembly protein
MKRLIIWLIIYSKLILAIDESVIMQKLNWQDADNSCKGRFNQYFSAIKAPKVGEHLTADEVSIDENSQTATGNVKILWNKGLVKTSAAKIASMKNGDSLLTLNENVMYESANNLIVAKNGSMNISQNNSKWVDAFFRSIIPEHGFFWGWSKSLCMMDQNHWELNDAGWSRCSVKNSLWHLEAKKIKINEIDDEVTIKEGWFYLTDVPLVYFPYLTVPLSKKRKTGFLMPKFSSQHYSGSVVHFPWYWNIAANQDAKISPFASHNNGVGLNGNWRYLSSLGFSKIKWFFLQDSAFNGFRDNLLSSVIVDPLRQNGLLDLQAASKNRWYFSLFHNYQDSYEQLTLDFNIASDDDLTRQFPFAFNLQEDQYLPQYASFKKSFTNISHEIIWSQWQVMHSLLWQPIVTPFQAVPEVHSFGFYDFSNRLQMSADVRFGKFNNQQLSGLPILPTGVRAVFDPALFLKLFNLKATIKNHFVMQNLENSHAQSWSVPKFILDWQKGFWSKNLHLLFRTMYVWAPYVNQSGMSHFDMDWMPQFYQQLFMDNRFSGNDWQGDVNRLSLGVELNSHFANEKYWSFALGQAFSFKQHQVCIDDNCIGDVLARQKLSELQLMSIYKINSKAKIQSNLAWDWYGSQSILGQIDGEYKLLNHDLHLGYMHIKMPQDKFFINHMWQINNDVKNFYIGADSEITNNLSSKINMHWDFDRSQVADVSAELSMKTCCANFQIGVLRRFNKSVEANRFEYENRVYLRLSFLT